jgi:hypothetical protein
MIFKVIDFIGYTILVVLVGIGFYVIGKVWLQ